MNGTEFARISGSYNTAWIATYQNIGQNTGGNYTTFRLYGYFYYGGGTQVSSSYSTFQVDGTNFFTGSYAFSPGYHLLGTKDITVYHNNDGSWPGRSIGIYANSWHMSGSTSGGLWAPNITRQAYVTGATDFNDEGNPRITFTNPAGFRINARLEFSGTVIRRDNIANTGSYTFNLTEAERNLLRSKTPNSNSLGVREVIATCLSGTTENFWSWQDKTMTIVNANPTFDNFVFEDINPVTLALTGNDQNIIKGYSNVKVTISTANKAIANKSAMMNKYRFSSGDKSTDITYNANDNVIGTIQAVPNGTFNVYAIDSRNNSKLVTKNSLSAINYNGLIKNNISVTRANGVSERTNLTLSGIIDLVNFGEVTNSIKQAKYRYKATDTSQWSEYTNIILSVDENGNFTFNNLIAGDTDEGFDIGNSYNIEVYVADELSNVTFTGTLNAGIPNIALHKNGVGIMGKYDTTEGGLLQVAGKKMLFPYVLYENSSGTSSNITLSDDVNNYEYIEIYYLSSSDGGTGYAQSSTKVWQPNGKTAFLSTGYVDTSNFNVKVVVVMLSGTSITRPYGHWEFNDGTRTNTNYVAITRVVGYK